MFSQKIIDALLAFDKYGVRYIVVGGIAVVAYGHDSTTGDIDFWLNNDPENLRALENALLSCEFDHNQVKAAIDSYCEKGHLTITIDERFPFDLMPIYSTQISFDQAYSASKQIDLFGVKLRIVDLHTLIDMKVRAGRVQDYRDVAELKNIHNLK